jgi:ATP-dependent protease HslVU (ClpYQ) peptidase subunit
MTCIVAIKDGSGGVLMGADSAGVGGWSIRTRVDRKIYRVGPFLFGFTSSFRMGQLLAYSFECPVQGTDESDFRFMATKFIDAVRLTFKNGGFARRESETEKGGVFLVGYRGRIFRVEDDYQVVEIAHDFDACGCGEEIALGSLYSTTGKQFGQRATTALHAAAEFSNGVRGPFIYERLEATDV